MIAVKKPVIFDCRVTKDENCFPMIVSGKAHNEMTLGDEAGRPRRAGLRGGQAAGVRSKRSQSSSRG